MNNYRKIFSEGLNADDDFSVISKGQWVNAENIRTFTTDSGATGRIENVGGTALLFNTLPAGANKCIGGCEDEAGKRIIFMNKNANGDHGIYCYDKAESTTYTVLLNSQVSGGLNFDKYIHSAGFVNNLLFWTDGKNEPKCINIEAGIKLNHPSYSTTQKPYVSPLKYTTTTLIKRPPIYPVVAVKGTDADYPNNFIENNAYQFTYRFRYRDYQISALSAYSKLIPYNTKEDTYNKIDITIPAAEYIDDDIFAIDVCVKYGNDGTTFIVKTFDKSSDSADITAHNSGTPLTFSFYDDLAGEKLGAVESVTSFDIVPLLSETLEEAKNRLFLGNNTFGYNTPLVSSLTVTVGQFDTGGAGSFAGVIRTMKLDFKYFDDDFSEPLHSNVNYVEVASLGKFYYFLESGSILNAADAKAEANSADELAYTIIYENIDPPFSGTYWYSTPPLYIEGSLGDVTIAIESDNTGQQFFKSNSTYAVSIAFYDRFRRKCGIVKTGISVTIPIRTYNQSVFSSTLNWVLNNTNALTEIPDWAYYYQIHITQNQTTRFFEQINSVKSSYVTKDDTGVLTYNQTTWAINTNYAVSFDLTQLISNGLGYTFNENDLLIIYKTDGTSLTIPVIGVDGNNILCHPTDIGDLTSTQQFLIEIYTPYKAAITEPYYETGNVFKIINPGTSGRVYSILAGQINGDCYTIERDNGLGVYFVEAMSPNDKNWKIWQTDTGWPNQIDTIGQKTVKGSIAFSDVFIEGTKVNGLNKFQPLNTENLDSENGAIRKLQLANKVQMDGTVLLAICENEWVSIYLGEQEIFDTAGSAFIARSSGVLGNMKSLKGGMGTSNPESVFEYNGLVFAWSTRNGCGVQYSNNGLFPITKSKFVRPANLFSKKYASLTAEEIIALGSDPYIIGGFDPYHKEALFTIPSTESTPKGNLTDYAIAYPYDIYDGKGKTLMYKNEANIWLGSMTFEAEKFISMDNDLYSFKNGCLYIHNQNTTNFYGVPFKSKLMYVNNPGAIHTFLSIGLESNKKPSFVHLRTEDPYGQSSDLISGDFVVREGVISASLLRDRLSPNSTGDYNKKQITGDRLFGKALLVMLEYEFETDPTKLQLRVSDVGSTVREGTLINVQ